MSKPQVPMCSMCSTRNCNPSGPLSTKVDIDGAPGFCLMKLDKGIYDEAWKEFEKADVKEFARQASIQEAECYEHVQGGMRTKFPRVEETIMFAQKMKYKKLGLVFCMGLGQEALIFNKMLDDKGFEVVSVCCKTGGVDKEKIGLKPENRIFGPDNYETMCNPIVQAYAMNKLKPDWVIMMGLCVGHDTLFLKYCTQLITVLAVKDRVFGHNPMAAIYLSNSIYYGRLAPKKKK
jgi:uncharacterized metal-binding protein